ncbi:hypothetical protein Celaphus_00015385, partial [Cervus elaphus hippelaphus]
MTFIQTLTPVSLTICGGFLVREDFVMTAARCLEAQINSRLPFLCSQINVILGIHSVTASEWTQQRIPVLRPIPHPRYNQRNNRNDIMLLKVKTLWFFTWVTFSQPGGLHVSWDHGGGIRADSQGGGGHGEVQLTIQRDGECHSRFDFYTGQKQICVGGPREGKSTFL